MTSCEELLTAGSRQLGIELPASAIEPLCRYAGELVKWNRKMNLVGRAGLEELLDSHFLDSLTLLPLARRQAARGALLDIGSGAGFPGLALKIACPELTVTLVEPRLKRVSFLRHVIRTLKLKAISVEARRIEPGATAVAAGEEPFSLITSRAVADISAFLALAEGLCPAGGLVVCMKGPRAEAELAAWQQQHPASAFRLDGIEEWRLPFSGAQRRLVIFERLG